MPKHWHRLCRHAVGSPPWRSSQAACMQPWAACLGRPCSKRGAGPHELQRSLSIPAILWIWDISIEAHSHGEARLLNSGRDLHSEVVVVVWHFKKKHPKLWIPHSMQNASPFPDLKAFPVQSCMPIQSPERGTLFPNSLPAGQSELFPLETSTPSFCLCNLPCWISSAWITRRI